eukprot:4465899-Pyramimonas_sp.AAC.1
MFMSLFVPLIKHEYVYPGKRSGPAWGTNRTGGCPGSRFLAVAGPGGGPPAAERSRRGSVATCSLLEEVW